MRMSIAAAAALAVLAATPIASAAEPEQHQHTHPPERPVQPAAPAAGPVRTVDVEARDMAFAPREIQVHAGETLRLVIHNAGELRHEFVIGTLAEQQAHQAMMRQMPDMTHQDDNAVSLEPGETKTLVHRFGSEPELTFACNIPGHAEAGMIGRFVLLPP